MRTAKHTTAYNSPLGSMPLAAAVQKFDQQIFDPNSLPVRRLDGSVLFHADAGAACSGRSQSVSLEDRLGEGLGSWGP